MATVKQLINEAESKLDAEYKDVNVAKVLFYHLANKEPHELYLMYLNDPEESFYIYKKTNLSPHTETGRIPKQRYPVKKKGY